MTECFAGNENCRGGHFNAMPCTCDECKRDYYRCRACGAIVPGSIACICSIEAMKELTRLRFRENKH